MREFGRGKTIYESFVDVVDTLRRRPKLAGYLMKGLGRLAELEAERFEASKGGTRI
jgi:hypothetical protein